MQRNAVGAAGTRPGVRAGRTKVAAPPDPTTQHDRHTALGLLLLRAERGPDPTERILAVTRVALLLATDMLRPGTHGLPDTPTVILGQHYLSRRQLAERHRGDSMQLFLQELCSHEPLGPTQHPKYAALPAATTGPAAAAAAAGVGPPVAATLSLRLRPAAVAQQHQAGLLAQLGGGGRAAGGADGAPPAWVDCALESDVAIAFPRHAETYAVTLPSLVLCAPLAEACPLDLAGTATVACEATGLTCTLRFQPFKGGQLRGSVCTLLGEGQQEVAAVSGSWQGVVTAESAEGSGVLFDASQFRPPLSLTVNLAEPGPRAAPRLWTALLEALIYVDAAAAGKEGKRAAELAAALPPRLKRSLLYEVERSGLMPKQAAAEEAAAAPASSGGGQASDLLPPCVIEHHSVHGGLTYQLHYRVQAV